MFPCFLAGGCGNIAEFAPSCSSWHNCHVLLFLHKAIAQPSEPPSDPGLLCSRSVLESFSPLMGEFCLLSQPWRKRCKQVTLFYRHDFRQGSSVEETVWKITLSGLKCVLQNPSSVNGSVCAGEGVGGGSRSAKGLFFTLGWRIKFAFHGPSFWLAVVLSLGFIRVGRLEFGCKCNWQVRQTSTFADRRR